MPMEALFHASCALGVRPSGRSQFQRAAFLLGLALPSWRYFQALFPSEERKTTKSSDFRALSPPETADLHTSRYISLSPSWLFYPSRVFDPSYCAVRTSPARPSRTCLTQLRKSRSLDALAHSTCLRALPRMRIGRVFLKTLRLS